MSDGQGIGWYVAATGIMALALAGAFVGLGSFPAAIGNYLFAGYVVTILFIGVCAYYLRRVDYSFMATHERKAATGSVTIGLVVILLFRFVLPDGISVWTIALGLLPGLPFLWLALRAATRQRL